MKGLKKKLKFDSLTEEKAKFLLKLKFYQKEKLGKFCYYTSKNLNIKQQINIICFKLSKNDEEIYNICKNEKNFCNSCCTKIGNESKKCVDKCEKVLNKIDMSKQTNNLNIDNHPELSKEINREEEELNRLIDKTYNLKNLGKNEDFGNELFKRISSFPKRIKALKKQFKNYLNKNNNQNSITNRVKEKPSKILYNP